MDDERKQALQELINEYGGGVDEYGQPNITIDTAQLIDLWLEVKRLQAQADQPASNEPTG